MVLAAKVVVATEGRRRGSRGTRRAMTGTGLPDLQLQLMTTQMRAWGRPWRQLEQGDGSGWHMWSSDIANDAGTRHRRRSGEGIRLGLEELVGYGEVGPNWASPKEKMARGLLG